MGTVALKMDSALQSHIERIYEVPGFFGPLDAALFTRIFEAQDDAGVGGDVLEIGAFYGRSAILLEYLKGKEEVLHVSDLFEDTPPTRAGRMELASFQGDMPTRADFEAWFRSFHATIPVVHQGPSSALSPVELGRERFRFVHVDGSHTYEVVIQDVALAGDIATEGGVIVFDDFANVGHPGVAAALWPVVMQGELHPFASSPSKLYVTRGSDRAAEYRTALEDFATSQGYRCKSSELPDSVILSIWPSRERRPLHARVAGRVRRSIRRARVGRRTE